MKTLFSLIAIAFLALASTANAQIVAVKDTSGIPLPVYGSNCKFHGDAVEATADVNYISQTHTADLVLSAKAWHGAVNVKFTINSADVNTVREFVNKAFSSGKSKVLQFQLVWDYNTQGYYMVSFKDITNTEARLAPTVVRN